MLGFPASTSAVLQRFASNRYIRDAGPWARTHTHAQTMNAACEVKVFLPIAQLNVYIIYININLYTYINIYIYIETHEHIFMQTYVWPREGRAGREEALVVF